MSGINGVGSNSPIHKVVSQPISRPAGAEPAPTRASDRLELSGASHLLKKNDIRAEKVAEIKTQIEAGTYDADDAKMDVAIDRLLDDLLK